MTCAQSAQIAQVASSAFYARDGKRECAQSARMAQKPQNPPSAAQRLKALRNEAGLSLERMADRLGLPVGTYRHYEERLKGDYLPQDFVAQLEEALADADIDPARIRALGEMPKPDGFADTGGEFGPHARGKRLMSALDKADKPGREFVVGTDGHLIQIVATVDRDGVDRLIERLKILKNILD